LQDTIDFFAWYHGAGVAEWAVEVKGREANANSCYGRKMKTAFMTITMIVALTNPASAAQSLKGWSGPKPKTPCLCRHSEGKAKLGETICRRIGGQFVTLRCELVLNNTSWRQISEGCDTASLPQSKSNTPIRPL
jgi:hypothetical protein